MTSTPLNRWTTPLTKCNSSQVSSTEAHEIWDTTVSQSASQNKYNTAQQTIVCVCVLYLSFLASVRLYCWLAINVVWAGVWSFGLLLPARLDVEPNMHPWRC